MLCKDGTIQ